MVEVLPQFPAWLARAEHQLAAARPQLANAYRPWWQLLKTIEHTHRSADPAWQRGLQMAADWPLPLGPVLADPWSDHLFFADDRLVAVIDYGAVRVDSAAADLSRCLSSLCGNQPELRDIALQAYQAVRRLSVEERAAIEVFDQSSRWLAPLHWLRWLFIEQRFPPTPRIRQRLERIVAGQPF
jgi:Ser/Thr protein kinase RdoA (MazF antagonist)